MGSSDGDVKGGSDGFKALEACGNNAKGPSSRTEEITLIDPPFRRSVSAGSASVSPALNAIPESPSTTASTSSGNKPAEPRAAVSASAPIHKNSITSRSDMGIEGYGVKSEDGTLAKREIYFCGIIDILQYYNARKMGETVIRKAAGNSGQDISCVDPETYGKRFVKFISNLVEEQNS